jgi:hypothetical protein
MAKVEVWDADESRWGESQREYDTYSWLAEANEQDQWGWQKVSRHVVFHVDEETGIVTQDVAKFEKWIGGLK